MTVGIMTIGSLWYIALIIWSKKTKPVLSAWIIFAVTMIIGFWTYWHSPGHSIAGNIGNLMATLTIPLITAVIAIVQWWRDELAVSFKPFQKKCLMGAGFILALWVSLQYTNGGEWVSTTSNVLTQILVLVGYTAQAKKLWHETEDTESLFLWITVLMSSLISFYPALEKDDWLGMLYSARATLTSGITFWLVIRIKNKVAKVQNAAGNP